MRSAVQALVSIHDVMPSSFEDVLDLIELCQSFGIARPTLLIVPGLDWSQSQVEQIRRWSDEGFELAGHGWVHRHSGIKTWWHRFHSLFLSRDVAEHLSLNGDEVLQLMRRCGDWFSQWQIPLPEIYVPPAWALGDLPSPQFSQQPFEMVETFRGLQIRGLGFHAVPLLGYEADNWLRFAALAAFNRWNQFRALSRGTVRIGIHPFDHRLKLQRELRRQLARVERSVTYGEYRTQVTSDGL